MQRHLLITVFSVYWVACEAPSKGEIPNVARGALYVPRGNPFAQGELATRIIDVRQGEFKAPRPIRLHGPTTPGTYPLVQFQHGFLSDRRAYDELLSHLASHGFVVVAPQMYPADGVPLGKPTAQDEAKAALDVAKWAASSVT